VLRTAHRLGPVGCCRVLPACDRIVTTFSLDVKRFECYSLDIKILDAEKLTPEMHDSEEARAQKEGMRMRLSDPQTTKILADAHVELLRGRRLRRRPKAVRAN
jgi:hypothetical protein